MKTLLLIASPRKENSRSQVLCYDIIEQLKKKNSDMMIDTFHLFEEDLPEVNQYTAEAKYVTMMGGTPTDTDWERVAKMSKNFASYDCYVIGTPMWNFTIPYKLKHYIDIVVQPGISFHYTEKGPEGLLSGKKMYIATTHGGDYSQEPMKGFNFLEAYLRSIFGFIGIKDIQVISAQPLDISAEISVAAISGARLLLVDFNFHSLKEFKLKKIQQQPRGKTN